MMRLKRPASLYLMALLVLLPLLASCARHSRNFYFGHYSEAEQHYNKGEYSDAIEKYQAYIDEEPEGNLAVIARYYMAKSYMSLGQSSEAQRLFQGIVDEYPDLIWANFSRTQLEELQGPSAA